MVGLLCLATSMQQKSRVRILGWNLCAAISMFVSCCFLWNFSAMVLMGVSSVRSVTALIFAIFPSIKFRWLVLTNVVLGVAIVGLNIVFWQGYLSVVSMVIGIGFIVAFAQSRPSRIRYTIAPFRIISTTYYLILFAPINAVIEITAFVSTVIGIWRYRKRG